MLAPALHLGEQIGRRRPHDIMDLLDLIELVRPGKQREERHDLEKHAADAPHVHLVVVVPVRQEALGRSVPTSGDVFCVGLRAGQTGFRTQGFAD